MAAKPYKLLIRGTLVQKTAFSTGGSPPDDPDLDMHLARNGRGEFVLRGSSLAGAFIATALELYSNHLPKNITEGTPAQQPKGDEHSPRMNESVWIFHNAHPQGNQDSEIRDQVAISTRTGAARNTAKFDCEILPAGTRWDFLMEIDRYRDLGQSEKEGDAAGIALNVIGQWEKHCLLGRDVARGMGWMRLKEVRYYLLDADTACRWPNAAKRPLEALEDLEASPPSDIQVLRKKVEPQRRKLVLNGTITITVGEPATDVYGLDFLSVGGHQKEKEKDKDTFQPEQLLGKAFLKQHQDKLVKPLGQNLDNYVEFADRSSEDADFSVAATHRPGEEKPIPHIPGSSLRGPLRHALAWLHNKTAAADCAVDEIFGTTGKSARLLISDALPVGNDWQMLVLEMHAEDEFTQGVYGSGKFDRTCLTRGKFEADFLLEAENEEQLVAMCAELQRLRTLGEQRLIPLGGGSWKGLGWVRWDICFTDKKNRQ